MRRRVLLAWLFVGTSFVTCTETLGPEVVAVPIERLDDPASRSAALGEQSLTFALHADRVHYEGGKNAAIEIDVELMRGKDVVDKSHCKGFTFDSEHTGGCGSTSYDSGCNLIVPKAGADAVRVRASLVGGGSVKFEKMELRAYRQ